MIHKLTRWIPRTLFYPALGADMGTRNFKVCTANDGVIFHDDSAVAVNTDTRKVLAAGAEARKMLGRGNQKIIGDRPLEHGAVKDEIITTQMVKSFLRRIKAERNYGFSPGPRRVIAAVASCVTQLERRAIERVYLEAGAKEVVIVEQTAAAAIGLGLLDGSFKENGSMVLDIGGGTTQVTIFSCGGVVFSLCDRFGGDDIDDWLAGQFKEEYQLEIGQLTAEEIKIKVGCAWPYDKPLQMEVRGKPCAGRPKDAGYIQIVNSNDICKLLNPCMERIGLVVQRALAHCPPEVCADIMDGGVHVVGGGALLGRIAWWLSNLITADRNHPVQIHIRKSSQTVGIEGVQRMLAMSDKQLKPWRLNGDGSAVSSATPEAVPVL